jgi:hypothetical protein
MLLNLRDFAVYTSSSSLLSPQPFGLHARSMVPGYGLAEHTVYVCDGGRLRLDVDKIALEERGEVVVLKSHLGPASELGGGQRAAEGNGVDGEQKGDNVPGVVPEARSAVNAAMLDSPSVPLFLCLPLELFLPYTQYELHSWSSSAHNSGLRTGAVDWVWLSALTG